MFQRAQRRRGIERYARLHALLMNGVERAVQMAARLGMYGKHIRACGFEIRDIALRICNHQMYVKEQAALSPNGGNHRNSERNTWHEISVHDVNMQPFDTGSLHFPNLLAKAIKICG